MTNLDEKSSPNVWGFKLWEFQLYIDKDLRMSNIEFVLPDFWKIPLAKKSIKFRKFPRYDEYFILENWNYFLAPLSDITEKKPDKKLSIFPCFVSCEKSSQEILKILHQFSFMLDINFIMNTRPFREASKFRLYSTFSLNIY